jgi:DNA-directed RNA polymerase subunit alpha
VESDDVSSFTLANALMSLGRPAEAEPIFRRLSDAYPQEPRPRGGYVEARLESDLASGDEELARKNLEEALSSAPEGFEQSAEGQYLHGRATELAHEWETALDHYEAARDADPTHRATMFHQAYLSERCGLDEEALDAYETLVKLLPIDKTVLFNLGVLYEDLGQDADAAACYDTIVRADPTDRRARLYLQDARSAMDMFYDEDLERKEDRLNQILRTPITDFELSVRASNCLNKMDIVTLGDLVRQTEQELLAYNNFGETSLNEIKDILTSKNLRLGMSDDEAVASIEAA